MPMVGLHKVQAFVAACNIILPVDLKCDPTRNARLERKARRSITHRY